jgi:hypothetical protein
MFLYNIHEFDTVFSYFFIGFILIVFLIVVFGFRLDYVYKQSIVDIQIAEKKLQKYHRDNSFNRCVGQLELSVHLDLLSLVESNIIN